MSVIQHAKVYKQNLYKLKSGAVTENEKRIINVLILNTASIMSA